VPAQRFAALDTPVLLGVEAAVGDDCQEAYNLLRGANFIFRATPTVIQELERIREDHRRELARPLAESILASPGRLALITAPFSDTETEVTEIHANRLLEKGILGERFRGHLTALIEAAYADCLLFITKKEELLESRDSLTLALIQICGMKSIYIVSPAEIVSIFKDPPP
jgi:hypothetical protein